MPRGKDKLYNKCELCEKPGRVEGLELVEGATYRNVYFCEKHWEPYKDMEGETITISKED